MAKVASIGTLSMMVLMVLGGLGLGAALKASPSESMFVAACLSLSSTPLVVRFLSPPSDAPASEGTLTVLPNSVIGLFTEQNKSQD